MFQIWTVVMSESDNQWYVDDGRMLIGPFDNQDEAIESGMFMYPHPQDFNKNLQ
jgi:hypothetical protein